jgi:hypothetical protein
MFIDRKQAVALARAMGWFSIGLGAVEVLAAKPIARWLGVPGHTGKIRGFGLRELKAGWSILRSEEPTPGQLVSRVVGDVMDLAALGAAARTDNAKTGPLVVATVAVVGATVADVIAAIGLKWGGSVRIEETFDDVVEGAKANAQKMADAMPMPTAVGIA